MSGAEETSVGPEWSAAGAPAANATPRGRLFRKYALLFIALVGVALLVTSGFDFWFSYQENKAALVRVQQEKAQAAAARIEEFIGEIERQIGWTTHAQWAAAPLDQRRQDYFRLLRQVPAITELAQLDAEGREQLKVSRLSMDVIGSAADFSQTPAFKEAKAHRLWFSPVYFRKESEPYMTLAIARDGRNAGVTVAEINLKLIWDVITAMKIGEQGYAYVVDGAGRLIAHPDISLVLRDTDLSKLPQVAAALSFNTLSPTGGEGRVRGPTSDKPAVTVAKNLAARAVLTAHAPIQPLGWLVFVEVPLKEAFAPLYGAALRTLFLLAAGLIAAALVALLLARRMTGPIRAIAAGAERLGAGELDRRIEVHTGDELEALAGQFNRMAGDLQKSYAELERRVRDRTAELSEALDQQTATAEVLGVINSSPGDLAPVFDAILEKAYNLCEVVQGTLLLYDGEKFRAVAGHGYVAALTDRLRQPYPLGPNHPMRPLLDGARFVEVADLAEIDDNMAQSVAKLGGFRTTLFVPLRKDDSLVGVITAARTEVRRFTDKQIALLQNFAAQAVIAMENARLITETREALDQQTATAEVLGVINSSPGNVAPVFDAMLGKATTLCDAAFGNLYTYEGGDRFLPVAVHGSAEFAEWFPRRGAIVPPPGAPLDLILRGENVAHIADATDTEAYRTHGGHREVIDRGGIRTWIGVALRTEDGLLGAIVVYRREVRPFTDKQIALLQNFAAQAVIAMENARLITETREALEQQTATAEVLGVINSSPGDLAPVFDAILEKAHALCGIAQGSLELYDGEWFRAVAVRGLSESFAEMLRQGYRASDNPATRPLIEGERFSYIADMAEADYSIERTAAQTEGVRTLLCVPLRREGQLLGMIASARREVRPFTDKQIALLENFATQAVIAMENARLITETREALEQQTATAEVLGVINSSPGDLAPVFDAMLEKALGLCGCAFGFLQTYDGQKWHTAAMRDLPPAFAEFRKSHTPSFGPRTIIAKLLSGEAVSHILDAKDDDAYRSGDPNRRALVDLGGARTAISVALRKDGRLLGAISAYRQEVKPFTVKQIALLQNFAAQAVIAMENARLISETREALEQQTATAEVLGVINSSPGDLAPVFAAMVERAARLCEADEAALRTYDGELLHLAAVHGSEPEIIERLRQLGPTRAMGLYEPFARGERIAHYDDVRETRIFRESEVVRARLELRGIRTWLAVALQKDGTLLGVLLVHRHTVRPFTDKQIALLQNFAAQAVIAMENARLITETREALEQQTATAEVLGVINSSPGELAPVFEAMLDKAMRLCGITFGTLQLNEGGRFRAVAVRGVADSLAELLRQPMEPLPGTPAQRLLAGERFVQITDMAEFARRHRADRRGSAIAGHGLNTVLFVPLRKDAGLLGYIAAFRADIRPFSDKQIALLENFAAQAVIAMENARLITETRERTRDLQEALDYQTAISDVLRVISGSAFDLKPVLQTVVATATRLCRADHAGIFRNFDGEFRWAAGQSLPREYEAIEREVRILPGSGTLVGRAALERQTVQILDCQSDPLYEPKEDARVGNIHTMLGVPLLRDGVVIGVIGLARQRIEAFADKQIELVATFADQAVIAIENARLLGELRSRTDELGRSVEELKALSEVAQAVSSTLDVRGVLSTILNRSVDLAGVDAGAIFRYSRAERSFRFVEAVGYTESMVQDVRALDVGENVTGLGIAIANRAPLQIPDLRERPPNPLRDQAIAAGYRSVLIVPLVGADRIMGATVLQRRAVGEFPEATVRLMQTLAAQSVLAIQNARLFREIAEKSEQLAEASRHKSQFLANMSHELRTPLNAILGYTELLADGIYGELAPRAAGVLERVQNNGKHLLALINDVLDLAKIEAGQLSLTLEDYAMPDVVQSVVSATESLANNKGLKFTADIAPGLPTGHGDSRRLAQVLLNLTGNAIKFTDAGEVAIGAAAEDGHFVLTVRDTGPGIAPEDQGKIFEEFQQVDNSNTRKKGGTGLGLAISKRMVEMQGGTISVESELGHGATFRVMLPIRVESVPDELTGELLGAAQ